MNIKLSRNFLIAILVIISSAGCSLGESKDTIISQEASLTPPKTLEPTQTPMPTYTITPTQPPTYTATPVLYVGSVVISPENVSQIVKISQIGEGTIRGVTWSPDGKTIGLRIEEDNFIHMWDVEKNNEMLTIIVEGRITIFAWSPDGKTVAFGSEEDNAIHLWNLEEKEEVFTLKGHSDSIFALTFSPDGNLLASSTWVGREVLLWDLTSGEQFLSFEGATDDEPQIAFSPDGRKFAYGGLGNTVRIWDIESARELYQLGGHRDYVTSLAFAPDGNTLISSSRGSIMLWDLSTGTLTDTLKLESNCWFCDGDPFAASLVFSPDGNMLASIIMNTGAMQVEREGFILWDIDEKAPLIELRNDYENGIWNPYLSVRFFPDGNNFILYDETGRSEVWSVLNKSFLTTWDISGYKGSSPDGKTLAIRPQDGDGVTLWGIP